MSGLSERCTATLHPSEPGEAEGILADHPAGPAVHSTRSGDRLHLRFLLGERIIGAGVLVLDLMGDPPSWAGEVTLDGCRWWATSPLGTGILTFTAPRGPGRERPT
jgi:hypothetical protein